MMIYKTYNIIYIYCIYNIIWHSGAFRILVCIYIYTLYNLYKTIWQINDKLGCCSSRGTLRKAKIKVSISSVCPVPCSPCATEVFGCEILSWSLVLQGSRHCRILEHIILFQMQSASMGPWVQTNMDSHIETCQIHFTSWYDLYWTPLDRHCSRVPKALHA